MDGRIDGKFLIKQGGITQGMANEQGLTRNESKKISGSIWTQVSNEFNNEQNMNVQNNHGATPNAGNNAVHENAVTAFSKECGGKIVGLINSALGKNIQVKEAEQPEQNNQTENTDNNTYIVLKLDSEGREVLVQNRGDDGRTYRTSYEYDKAGNIAKEITLCKEDENYYSETLHNYQYDNEGNCYQQENIIKTSKNDNKHTIATYNYSEDSTIEHYNEDNEQFVSKRCTYWDGGQKFEEIYEQGANITNRIDKEIPNKSIEYDENGNILKITQYSFDENGVISAIKITDGQGKTIVDESNFEVDGNFNVSFQGQTGDCYLLASIDTLSKTEAGLQILRNNVQHNPINKTYTISFPGAKIARENLISNGLPEDKVFIQESYTITEKELLEAAKSLKYSRGDKDVLLYEVAYEKYRQDAARTTKENNIECNTKYVPGLYGGSPNEIDKSNLKDGPGSEVFYMITGNKSETYERYNNETHTGFIVDRSTMRMTYSNTANNNYISPNQDSYGQNDTSLIDKYGKVTNFGNNDSQFENIMSKVISESNLYGKTKSFTTCSLYITIDGEEFMPHQFRIVSANDSEVTLVNPWNTSKENITVSMEEFKTGLFDLTLGQYPDDRLLAQN